ncbi:hypothetical protein H1R20_g9161, partial [Candolleomyces eurysporus]
MSSDAPNVDSCPKLSQYGVIRLHEGIKVAKYEEVLKNMFSDTNPDGIVNMGVAENTLMCDFLSEYFEKHFKLRDLDFTYGDSLASSRRLRDALARFFNAKFEPWKEVSVEHLMAGAGLLPVTAQLGRALVDPGNGILLTSPYYHGFDFALTSQHNIKLVGVPVPLGDLCTLRELDHFATSLKESEARGTKIQAVLLCNPQNPYGRCYPLEVVAEYCRFCEEHNLHLISDEIYALSTFSSQDVPNPEPFHSVISLDLDSIGVKESRIHMIYGMSKDFDANGFRAGVLFTRNDELFKSLLATSIFMLIASPTAGLWSGLLNDQSALETYIERNQEALRDAYEHITGWLRFHGVSYLPSAAGHFLMVDFRQKLLTQVEAYGSMVGITEDQDMVERERSLQVYLATQCKVVLGSGIIAGGLQSSAAVRQPLNNTPVEAVNSQAMVCNNNPRPASETVSVAAGSSVGFKLDNTMYHQGPAAIYLGQVPGGQTAASWNGAGSAWFKIAEWGARFNPFQFTTQNLSQLSATIPRNTPSGNYLLRIEQIGLHVAGKPQYYISCAQITITGGGSGNPPKVSIPGYVSASDPGLTVNIYNPVPTSYTVPGPRVWTG